MNVQKVIFCGSKAVQPGQKVSPFGMKEINGKYLFKRTHFLNIKICKKFYKNSNILM